MRSLTLFFVAFFLFCFVSSLRAQEEHPEIEWFQSFFLDSDIPVEKQLESADLLLQGAVETRDVKAEAHARKTLGLTHLTRTHDYEKAITQLIQALAIEDSLDLRQERIFSLLAIARVFEQVGDYMKSAGFLEEALELNRPMNNHYIKAIALNRLGKINAALGHIDDAFDNYDHVLKAQAEIGEPSIEAEALFNIGNLHRLRGNYEKAYDFHKQALNIRRSLGDKKNEAQSLNDIGEVYKAMKIADKALANHVIALEIRHYLKDKQAIAESYNNIGVLYYEERNMERAIANLKLGLEAAQESDAQEQIMKASEYLSFCFREMGDYKTALEYRDQFFGMSEFTQHEKNEQRLLDVQSRYELGRKESQIERLENIRALRDQQLREAARFRYFLFAIMALGVVIVVLVFYLYVTKQKSNRVLQKVNTQIQEQNVALQELNATKDKFFSIISHDLKGPLNSLTSFSGLLINHTDSLSREEITMLAKDLDKSLKNLFALLENLLEWSRSQTGNIEFKPEPFDMNQLLEISRELLGTQAGNKNIVIENLTEGEMPVHVHKHSVNTVVRNLLSNAIKFTPAGGKVTLKASIINKEIVVSVADTGVGMAKEIMEKLFRIDTKHSTRGTADEKGTGLGLILCKEFIEKNGGRIWVDSEVGKGTVFYFALAKQSMSVDVQTPVETLS